MKLLSTIFTILILITGISLKLMRLQRLSNGENVSSFDIGYEAGVAAAGSTSHPTGPAEVQQNPFVD